MRLVRLLGRLLAPAGPRGGLSILLFHRVLREPDPLAPDLPDARHFDALLSWVGAAFTVLPLEEAIGRLEDGTLPARALALSFDDGYADNCTVALPLLRRHRMHATVFVATDYLDGGCMWNDTVTEALRRAPGRRLDLEDLGLGRHGLDTPAERLDAVLTLEARLKYREAAEREALAGEIARRCRAELPRDLMMTSAQLLALRDAGMGIGGHTCSHPILATLEDARAEREIAGGKVRLEALLGEPVALFAYPNGRPGLDYHARHADMVRRAGYRAAVSTSPGVGRRGTDLFQIPRFTPWDRTPLRFGLRMAANMRHRGRIAS